MIKLCKNCPKKENSAPKYTIMYTMGAKRHTQQREDTKNYEQNSSLYFFIMMQQLKKP